MSKSGFLARSRQVSLKTALIGLTVLGVFFAYGGGVARSYDREQFALSQIPDLIVTRRWKSNLRSWPFGGEHFPYEG